MIPERIADKIEPDGDCWIWTAAVGTHGYGAVWIDGATTVAHRAVYEFLVGPIPEGLTLDHVCRRTLCVNPDHLDPVSHRTNCLRGNAPAALIRRRRVCARGHRLVGDNVYDERPNGTRYCRACRTITDAARARREREPAR